MTASAHARAGRLAVWSAFLTLTLRLLHGAAFGRLSIPLSSLDELATWLDQTSPTVMALAVVRLGALGAAWYLTVATILAVVADLAGWRRLAAVVAALSPRIVHRLACRSAGVGLAAGALLAVAPLPSRVVATPASATAEPPGPQPTTPSSSAGTPAASAGLPPDSPQATATMTRLPGADPRPSQPPATATMARLRAADPRPSQPPATATMARLRAADPGPRPPATATATMTRLPGRGTSVTATMTQLARADGPDRRRPSPVLDTPDDARGLDADADAVPETWTVAAGDSFWSIADEVLTDAAGRRPPEHQVRRYWLELIETNRPGLADPANPDLLIPGQQLELPPAHS